MKRPGVTLVELLIVILIILMISAVTVAAISPALEGRKVREAARMVEVFLNGARNRAIGSGHSVGVLIEPDQFEPSQCVSLSYVEQPDPYAGDYDNSTVNILGNGGFGAWQVAPQVTKDKITGAISYTAGSSAGDSVFPNGDVGWLANAAPGDLITLGTDDTTIYRIYLGEPFIDANGNGKFDPGEPFNDVDGSGLSTGGEPWGVGYTPPDPSLLDPVTGYFKAIPSPVKWGTPSASITYTYADQSVAINHLSPTGLAFDNQSGANAFNTPLYIGAQFGDKYVSFGTPSHISTDPGNTGTATGSVAFQVLRRPVKTSSATINLPAGTCIDLGSNYIDPATGNIVGIPGSGLDMVVPFSSASPATGAKTLGYYSTFRPNPLTDHEILGTTTTPPVNRPLMITFDQSGIVDLVYSWDERHFIPDNTSGSLSSAIQFTDYQGRLATSPIYFLIGRSELIDGDPELIGTLKNGAAPQKPIFNMQDPSSLWVAINPRTGLISTTENVAPDLTVAPPTTQTPTSPQIQLYFNVQAYQARSLVRAALDMGGM